MASKVLGQGPTNAKIVLVGEAPGRTEAAMGQPFAGSSGQLLNSMLEAVGIRRADVYTTNVVKIRPPDNNFGVFYVDKQRKVPSKLLLDSIEELKEEIKRINPNVIVALGDEALRALTGRMSIMKWRGSIIETPLGKVVPTIHPTYVLRMYESRAIVELDLRRAKQESESRLFDRPKYNLIIDPTFEQVMDFLSTKHKRLSFDIETTGERVRTLGFGFSARDAICIPFISNPNRVKAGDTVLFLGGDGHSPEINSHWSEEEEYQILKKLDALFQDKSIEFVAQNFPFDATILAKEFGFDIANLHMDTMVAFHTCYSELPKSLDFLTSIYTRAGYYADYDASDDRSTWIYNAMDCAVTYEVSERLDDELAGHHLKDYYHFQKQPSMIAATRMQNRGIKVDLALREKLATEHREKMDKARAEFETLVPGVSISSPKQLLNHYYYKVGLPPQFKISGKDKRITFDEEAINKLIQFCENSGVAKDPEARIKELKLILKYREHSKVVSTFLEAKLTSSGRMETSFNVAGTRTGRLSSSKTIFGTGGNLQNIPRGSLRRIYRADRRRVLIKSDLAQAEYRFVVWDAPIPELIEKYKEDRDYDVHTLSATRIFDIPWEEVSKDQRKKAKDGNFGGNYGMKARKASKLWGISYKEADFVLRRYHEIRPEIQEWWKKIQEQLHRTRSLTNPLGAKRIFFGRFDDDLYRAAYSALPQGTIGDLVNRALYVLEGILPGGCGNLLQVHDELVVQAPPQLVPRVVKLIKSTLEYPMYFDGIDEPLIIPTEPSVGPNWYDQTDYEEWLPAPKCGECFHVKEGPHTPCSLCGSLTNFNIETDVVEI